MLLTLGALISGFLQSQAYPGLYQSRSTCQPAIGNADKNNLPTMGAVVAAEPTGLKLLVTDMSDVAATVYVPGTQYKLVAKDHEGYFLVSATKGDIAAQTGIAVYPKAECSAVANSCSACSSYPYQTTFTWVYTAPAANVAPDQVTLTLTGGNIGTLQQFSLSLCKQGASCVPTEPVPPSPPTNIRLWIGSTDTVLEVLWDAPTDVGSSPITNYTVTYRKAGTSRNYTSVLVAGTSATLSGLTANTAYDVAVGAISNAGAGALSSSTSLSTFANPPRKAEAPTVSRVGVTETTIAIRWVLGNDYGYPPIPGKAHTVEWKTIAASMYYSDTTADLNYTIRGLAAATSYIIRVTTMTFAGNSSTSAELDAVTLAVAACPDNCNNHGTCSEKQCSCQYGYLGESCGLKGVVGCLRTGICYAIATSVDTGEVYFQSAVSTSLTTGWTGWLVNVETSGMNKADAWIMHYPDPGTPTIEDRWSSTTTTPATDANGLNDLVLLTANRNSSYTNFHFKRNLTVPDKVNDKDIDPQGDLKLAWAYGTSATSFDPHSGNARGKESSINLLTGAVTQPQEISRIQVIFPALVISLAIVVGAVLYFMPTSNFIKAIRYGKPMATSASAQWITERTWAELFFLAIYVAGNVAFILVGMNSLQAEGQGVEYILGQWAAISLAVALLTPVKNGLWVPLMGMSFERAILWHRMFGRVAFSAVILHFFFMLARFNGGWNRTTITTYVPNEYGLGTGYGFVALVFMVAGLAFVELRRRNYELFRYPHYFLLMTVIMAALHSVLFCYLLIAPGILLCIDYIFKFFVLPKRPAVTAVAIGSTKAEGSSITMLKMTFAKQYKHEAGDYVMLTIPQISRYQQHPFSISSGPHMGMQRNSITCHIKNMGEGTFTGELHELVKSKTLKNVYVEGPYGKVTVPYKKYKSVVLVAGGIGATPLMSVLHELLHLMQPTRNTATPEGKREEGERRLEVPSKAISVQHVTLVWTDRDVSTFQNWFAPLLSKAAKTPGFGIHLYCTTNKAEETVAGGGVIVKPGRPDLDAIFSSVPGADTPEEVCCLACGPAPLVMDADNKSWMRGWAFHKETFFL
eukprot:gb/GEZN01001054.1/.p1 GENE.gb/GEZN01001054.1/~~gb/GEZN01001054.1/.p1  ORF type:complete len:1086 (+),score=113.79 gb/GEZN01001054.1/:40-3297(+)